MSLEYVFLRTLDCVAALPLPFPTIPQKSRVILEERSNFAAEEGAEIWISADKSIFFSARRRLTTSAFVTSPRQKRRSRKKVVVKPFGKWFRQDGLESFSTFTASIPVVKEEAAIFPTGWEVGLKHEDSTFTSDADAAVLGEALKEPRLIYDVPLQELQELQDTLQDDVVRVNKQFEFVRLDPTYSVRRQHVLQSSSYDSFSKEDIKNLLDFFGVLLKLGGHARYFFSATQLPELIRMTKRGKEAMTLKNANRPEQKKEKELFGYEVKCLVCFQDKRS